MKTVIYSPKPRLTPFFLFCSTKVYESVIKINLAMIKPVILHWGHKLNLSFLNKRRTLEASLSFRTRPIILI